MVIPEHFYDATGGKLGHQFVIIINEDLAGIREQLRNANNFIVFHTLILQHVHKITGVQLMQRQILKWIDE